MESGVSTCCCVHVAGIPAHKNRVVDFTLRAWKDRPVDIRLLIVLAIPLHPTLQTSETCKRSNANSPEIITALYAANSASDRSADDQSQKRLESFLQMRSILRGQRRKSISKALRVSLTATRDTASLLDRRDAARTHPRPERSVFYWSLHVASTTLSFLSRRADASSGVKMISVFFGASFSVRKLLRLK